MKSDRKVLKLAAFWVASVMLLISFFLILVLTYAYFYGIPRQALIEALPGPIRNGIDRLRDLPYATFRFKASKLPVCDLSISESNYREIVEALPKSIGEILDEDTKISEPATYVCNDKEWDIRIGVRGDKFYHWFYEKKSWNLKFSEIFDGNSEIKLIIPSDRGYVAEYFNSYRANKLELQTPEDKFVTVRLNNGPPALYYQMDGWTKEFLQKVFGTDDGNLYGETGVSDPIFDSVSYWKKYVSIEGQDNDFSDLAALLSLIKNADDPTFKREIWGILDEDNFYDWQVHSMLSGSPHQSFSHNIRLFFDKEKGKFFLIPWNVGLEDYTSYFDFSIYGKTVYDLDVNYNPLVTRILAFPEFLSERNLRLWNYISDDNNFTEDLDFFDKTVKDIEPALFSDPTKFWRSAVADRDIKNRRQWLISNYNFLEKQLDQADLSATISRQINSYIPLVIDLRYISSNPLELKGLNVEFGRLSGAGPVSFDLYEDTNSNGTWDLNDKKLGDLNYRDGSIFSDNLNGLFYSDRKVGELLAPVSIEPTNKTLFIAASRPVTIDGPSGTFDVFNAITRTKLVPKIQIINGDTTFK